LRKKPHSVLHSLDEILQAEVLMNCLYMADEVRLFTQHLAANEALGFAQMHGKVSRAVDFARERFVARAAIVFAVFRNDFEVVIVGPNVGDANVPFQLLLRGKA
jgi:Flp pilus assembly secretin CpaC